MTTQLEQNKATLLKEIKEYSEKPMTNSVAEHLCTYKKAYEALCMVEEEPRSFNIKEENLYKGGDNMRSYGNEKVLSLMKKAIDIEAKNEKWHHKHMLWAQSNGLQGHKRLNRYKSKCNREHYIKMENYCIDMFGSVIEPDWSYSISTPNGIKQYLESYLDWADEVYSSLASISNDLIMAGYPNEAELVREGLPVKEVEKIRRMLVEYELSGWNMPYILLKDKELHDKIKELE